MFFSPLYFILIFGKKIIPKRGIMHKPYYFFNKFATSANATTTNNAYIDNNYTN